MDWSLRFQDEVMDQASVEHSHDFQGNTWHLTPKPPFAATAKNGAFRVYIATWLSDQPW